MLALARTEQKNQALAAMAAELRRASGAILAANAADLARAAAAGRNSALVDRLKLDPPRLEAMAQSLEEIAALPDPVGETTARWSRPNGLEISRVRVPIGVIGIIFESRPNVTADAGGLCMKSGNAAILRGGSDSFETARVIVGPAADGSRTGRAAAGRDPDVADRVARQRRLNCLPASGARSTFSCRAAARAWSARVLKEARVPVLSHLEGVCHVYVHAGAEPAKALADLSQLQDAPHRRLWRGRDDPDRRRRAAGSHAQDRARTDRGRMRSPR